MSNRVVVVIGDAPEPATAEVVVSWSDSDRSSQASGAAAGAARRATFTGPIDAVAAAAFVEFVTEVFGGVDEIVAPAGTDDGAVLHVREACR